MSPKIEEYHAKFRGLALGGKMKKIDPSVILSVQEIKDNPSDWADGIKMAVRVLQQVSEQHSPQNQRPGK